MAFAVVEDTFQVYLSSDGCLNVYPGNSPNNFSIVLKKRKEFRSRNQKYVVGLARFGYDSAMYNLGENTGVSMMFLIKESYITVTPKNRFVVDSDAAATALEEAVSNVKVGATDFLKNHVSFLSASKDVILTLTDVDDFGMSPMMRKLLGFHKNKKFKAEAFEFRKICREILFEVSKEKGVSANFSENLALIAEAFMPAPFKASKVDQRNNVFMAPFRLDVRTFFKHFRQDLHAQLADIIKGHKLEFEKFVETSYYKGEETFIDHKFTLNGEEYSIPSMTWTMIDFIIATVVRTSFHVQGSRTISPDVDFNPNLFHCLYVYTNLIKPVDFNDGEFRLLDIVLLKRTKGVQHEVVEHQSTQYKLLEVETLSEIQIVITTSLGLPAPFIYGPVFVVLEFRKV